MLDSCQFAVGPYTIPREMMKGERDKEYRYQQESIVIHPNPKHVM